MVTFDGADDRLTVEEFRALVYEYGLLKYAEDPGLLQPQLHTAAAA
jgi:hypothetical protein